MRRKKIKSERRSSELPASLEIEFSEQRFQNALKIVNRNKILLRSEKISDKNFDRMA